MMAPLPQTRRGLEDFGYLYTGESRCRACSEPLHWYQTPNIDQAKSKAEGRTIYRKMPMQVIAGTELLDETLLEPHWPKCPRANDFRKMKPKKENKHDLKPKGPDTRESDPPAPDVATDDIPGTDRQELAEHPETREADRGHEKRPEVRVEDFSPISPLVKAYELTPGKHYLILADTKEFSFDRVHSLLKDLREMHPELSIAIVATKDLNKLAMAEKKEECP